MRGGGITKEVSYISDGTALTKSRHCICSSHALYLEIEKQKPRY